MTIADVGIDGASVAVIDADGELWVATAGVADRASTPVDESTRFAVASITKTFTTVVALRLAERGVVDLDVPVDLRGLGAGTTLRHLLGHTAGLAYESRLVGSSWTERAFEEAAVGRRACEPDACFAYSDLGFVGVGLALEQATGEPFAALLRAEVLDPLELDDTALVEESGDAVGVAMLDRHDDPGPVLPDAAIPVRTWSAGALVTTATELVRFGRALFDGGLLEADSFADMQDVERSAALPCSDRCFRPYGLGLDRTRWSGRTAWGHSGSSGAVLAHFPDEGITVAVLTTRRDSGSRILRDVMNTVPGIEEQGDVFVVGIDGHGLRPVVTHRLLDGGPAWAPDAERIAFGSIRDGNPELYVADADGGGVRRLTDDPADDLAARWAPDGSALAFASRRAGNLDLYVVSAGGGEPRRLTNEPIDEELPSFSPDGTLIAFNTAPADGDGDIGIIAADGSDRRLFEAPGDDWFASWSPEGTEIVFQRTGAGIWVMDADGTDPRSLSPSGTPDRWPVWGPTERISFVLDGDVWTMAADGSDRRPVTQTPDSEDFAASWSPDGRFLLFASDRS